MDTNYEQLLNEFENEFKRLYLKYHPDSKEDNPLQETVKELREYPHRNYPITSREGESIEKMLFAFMEIKGLSPEEDSQRNKLANIIIGTKLRGYI